MYVAIKDIYIYTYISMQDYHGTGARATYSVFIR